MSKLFCLGLLVICAPLGYLAKKYEALKLIGDHGSYNFPSKYDAVENSSKLHFFCPVETYSKTGLQEYYLDLKENEDPSCSKPVKPLLIRSEKLGISCGSDSKSVYYDFVYRLILRNENKGNIIWNKINFQDLLIYRICYNSEKKETIFTYYPMISPTLLENEDTEKEQHDKHEYYDDRYELLAYDFSYRLKEANSNGKKSLMKSVFPVSNKSIPLKLLKLVSPFDLALPVWKQSTYHYINMKLAYENVIEMWEIIGELLRKMAIKVAKNNIRNKKNLGYEELNMIQMSGWMNNKFASDEDFEVNNAPEYFWKMAYIHYEDKIVTILLRNVSHVRDTRSTDKFCTIENQEEKIQELSKISSNNYEWSRFVQFCHPSEIVDKFHLPENLNFLLHKEYLLPLVLIYGKKGYHWTEEYEGLAKRTEFDYFDEKRLLFCPSDIKIIPEAENRCLLLNKDKDPYCKKSVEPISVKSAIDINCKGQLNDIVFKICDETEQKAISYVKKEIPSITQSYNQVVYSVCSSSKETHYTRHQILSPDQLKNSILKNEGELRYQTYRSTGIVDSKIFEKLSYPYATKQFFASYENKYELMQLLLVPPEDMVSPLFRKATYRNENMTIAWKNIVEINNIIHQGLRQQAISKNQELIQINGAMETLELYNDIRILIGERYLVPKYLWKVIYSPDMEQSIAIIIHNIPNEKFSHRVPKLCEKSICTIENGYTNMVSNLSTFAYCCAAEVITKIHGLPQTPHTLEMKTLNYP